MRPVSESLKAVDSALLTNISSFLSTKDVPAGVRRMSIWNSPERKCKTREGKQQIKEINLLVVQSRLVDEMI
jgi:hypothetical protein